MFSERLVIMPLLIIFVLKFHVTNGSMRVTGLFYKTLKVAFLYKLTKVKKTIKLNAKAIYPECDIISPIVKPT